MMSLILKIDNLIEGTIIKRPSKFIKSPYVADIIPFDSIDNMVIGHTASLGCCGLSDTGSTILMSPSPISKSKSDKLRCEYRVYLSILRERNTETIVGIHPKLAEQLAESALQHNLLSKLKPLHCP